MAGDYRTPGVYIEEKNAFPSSVVAVQTAVPAFIGYTEKAEKNGKDLKNIPTKVTSFSEYTQMFGDGYRHIFKLTPVDKSTGETFVVNGKPNTVVAATKFMLYNSIRLFYQNGGADCYIVSVGGYNSGVKASELSNEGIWKVLEKEYEPTMVLAPDAVSLTDPGEFYGVYTSILAHCKKMQSRFGIFDVPLVTNDDDLAIANFRDGIGANFLDYGAAYYPWVNTAIVQSNEIDFRNLDTTVPAPASGGNAPVAKVVDPKLQTDLDAAKALADTVADKQAQIAKAQKAFDDANKPDPQAQIGKSKSDTRIALLSTALDNAKNATIADKSKKDAGIKNAQDALDAAKANNGASTGIKAIIPVLRELLSEDAALKLIDNAALVASFDATSDPDGSKATQANTNFHQGLIACSPTYASIINEIKAQLNRLPPSAAMAGVYTMVDSTRGVWKAPANVSMNMVSKPTSNITSEQQASYNVDPVSGKSINIIRPFTGIGTMVWGARTLDGNSQDWRYINVRRTMIMIEQSIKLAMRAYVFEPNTASTWITVQSMITNFLTNMWKQGALAGAVPAQAFVVQIGLGTTMTPDDILDGKMLVTVMVAISRPAEFIILTFQQMQQQS